MSFRISLSGMNAASADLNITSNNIANSNTTGFKQSRGEFADVFPVSAYGLSKNAIGAGGFFGQGFTSGSQTQLNFLPVKTTDFVFSVWAEERGFLGVLMALGLFGMVMSRILEIARSARTQSESYYCVGAACLLGLHIFVNVGMVVGILPNKGIVLPFFSAGGSSTLSYFLGLGIVMGVQNRAKLK